MIDQAIGGGFDAIGYFADEQGSFWKSIGDTFNGGKQLGGDRCRRYQKPIFSGANI